MKKLSTAAFREQVFVRYKDKKVPIHGTFELTGRCNFNCKMCYVHTKTNAEFLKSEHDGDWWIDLIDKAYNKGMIFALLTGGECLLHPDFRRIYLHLHQLHVYTSINTNGYLLDQDTVEFLKQYPPYELQITLYGTDEESYYMVTGVRGFSRVKESIQRVKESGLNLKIAVTPNPHAPGETRNIVKYLKANDLRYTINDYLFTSYEDNSKQVVSEQELDAKEKIGYYTEHLDVIPRPIPEKDLPSAGGGKKEPILGLKCTGGRVAFVVTHDGCMQPCMTLHNIRVAVDDFDNAWEEMLAFSSNYLMPVECEGCAYKNACSPCPIRRGGKAGDGHCDPAVCELTRRLVAAGVKKLDQKPRSCEE